MRGGYLPGGSATGRIRLEGVGVTPAGHDPVVASGTCPFRLEVRLDRRFDAGQLRAGRLALFDGDRPVATIPLFREAARLPAAFPGGRAPRLGIAIRADEAIGPAELARQVDRLQALTATPHHLVLCRDGDAGHPADALLGSRVRMIGGRRRGAGWNLNRGLAALFRRHAVDVAILLHAGVRPVVSGWEADWIRAALLHGRVEAAATGDTSGGGLVRGTGRWFDPFVRSGTMTGACLAISRTALDAAGTARPDLEAPEAADAEHASRFAAAGYAPDADGAPARFALRAAFEDMPASYTHWPVAFDAEPRPTRPGLFGAELAEAD